MKRKFLGIITSVVVFTTMSTGAFAKMPVNGGTNKLNSTANTARTETDSSTEGATDNSSTDGITGDIGTDKMPMGRGQQNKGQRTFNGDITESNNQKQDKGEQTKNSPEKEFDKELIEKVEGMFSDTKGKITEELPVPTGEESEMPELDKDLFEETDNDAGETQKETSELAESEYSFVTINGDVTSSEYETFSYYLEMLNEAYPDIITTFEENGWELVLTTADLNDLLYGGQTSGVVGCTVWSTSSDGTSSGTIYVNSSEDYSYCVIHEFGHYLDVASGLPSNTDDFLTLYESESASLTEYGQTDVMEFFAEVFMYSILQPETTAESVPDSYEFVTEIAKAM